MLKLLKTSLLLFIIIALIFIIHVFIVKFFSTLHKYSDDTHPPISRGLETENYQMNLLFTGNVFGIWYDTRENRFIVIAQVINHPEFFDRSSHLYYVDAKGELLGTEKLLDGHRDELESNSRYQQIKRVSEKKYVPEYRFSELDGVIKLDHFQKEEFTWPYFYYFIPVIGFDWKGTGFVSYSHNGEDFKFKIPMDYHSRLAYLAGNYDGQLYYYPTQEYIADISFFEVDASYGHIEFGSGKEILREGYGLYVVHKK